MPLFIAYDHTPLLTTSNSVQLNYRSSCATNHCDFPQSPSVIQMQRSAVQSASWQLHSGCTIQKRNDKKKKKNSVGLHPIFPSPAELASCRHVRAWPRTYTYAWRAARGQPCPEHSTGSGLQAQRGCPGSPCAAPAMAGNVP